MDSIDRNILLDLFSYCRVTFQEIAEKNDVSANAIKKRFNKMHSMGVIEDFYVELSLAMVDADISMSLVTTDGTEDEEFIETIGNNPMVSYIGKMSGGIYNVFACFSGTSGLSELGSFLRNLPQVRTVELHPLLYAKGEKIEFSPLQLKVLRYLVEDSRMPVSEIAKRSGLTSRIVSKVINELKEGGGVNFTISWNPNAGGLVIMLRIHWDEKEINFNQILSLLQKQFPLEYFAPMISATNPLLFASFIVKDMKRVQEISQELKKNPKITSLITYLGEPSRVYPDIKTIRLKEILAEAGLFYKER